MMIIEETDKNLPLLGAAPPRCCSSGESLVGKQSSKLLSASDIAWAMRASNTTRLFAAVTPASPNTAASTGFFCWSGRLVINMFSVQLV